MSIDMYSEVNVGTSLQVCDNGYISASVIYILPLHERSYCLQSCIVMAVALLTDISI